MDVIREALRVFFVVGVVAIPPLYWFSGRAAGRNRAQNENKRAGRSEERNLGRDA